MDHIIAFRVVDDDSLDHHFITWGRVYGGTEWDRIEEQVREHLPRFGLQRSHDVAACGTLQEASRSVRFYECLFDMQMRRVNEISANPDLEDWLAWRGHCRSRLESGEYIWYAGLPASDLGRSVPPVPAHQPSEGQMDEVVAYGVEAPDGHVRFVLTWGRAHSVTDDHELSQVMADFANRLVTGWRRVWRCASLQEAASAPYFFEYFMDMQMTRFDEMKRDPKLADVAAWREFCRSKIDEGRHVWRLG